MYTVRHWRLELDPSLLVMCRYTLLLCIFSRLLRFTCMLANVFYFNIVIQSYSDIKNYISGVLYSTFTVSCSH